MKNTLLVTTLLTGLILTGCNKSTRTSTDTATTTPQPATDTTAASRSSTTPPATTTPSTTTDTLGAKIDRAGDRAADASREAAASLRSAGRDISARMTEWRLSKSDIEADVLANRPIVRTRSDAPLSAAGISEDTLEKSIKGRLQSDSMLASMKFDVNANKQGEVELEGKVRTTDEIARAMALALDNDGVTKVTSKLKLDPNAGANR